MSPSPATLMPVASSRVTFAEKLASRVGRDLRFLVGAELLSLVGDEDVGDLPADQLA